MQGPPEKKMITEISNSSSASKANPTEPNRTEPHPKMDDLGIPKTLAFCPEIVSPGVPNLPERTLGLEGLQLPREGQKRRREWTDSQGGSH